MSDLYYVYTNEELKDRRLSSLLTEEGYYSQFLGKIVQLLRIDKGEASLNRWMVLRLGDKQATFNEKAVKKL